MTDKETTLTDEQMAKLPGWADYGYEATTWGKLGNVEKIADADLLLAHR